VIAVDSNLLVYAHRADSSWHRRAERCIRGLAEGSAPWAIPWACVHEFLAIVTNARIYRPPTPLELALQQVEAWLASPSVILLGEKADDWDALKKVLKLGRITAGMVHDARIGALCMQHGAAVLWSADRDFSRIHGLKVVNPLI